MKVGRVLFMVSSASLNLIYGLVDPRLKGVGPGEGVRYVGQSSTGLSRATEHLWPSTLASDSNGHKTSWIKQLQSLGLTYEVVILETVPDSSGLDEAEIRIIAQHRAAGCRLVNKTDGGNGLRGFNHSEHTKELISKARFGISNNNVPSANVSLLASDVWTAEKAWWLGVSFRSLRVHIESGSRHVRLANSSESLLQRWREVIGAEHRDYYKREGVNSFVLEFSDTKFVAWLQEAYGFDAESEALPRWPVLPANMCSHFARGFWDVGASVRVKPRGGKKPSVVCGIHTQRSEVAEFISNLVPFEVIPKRAGASIKVELLGPKALELIRWLYVDAPETARCEVSYREACRILEMFEKASGSCVRCQVPIAWGKLCRGCNQIKNEGNPCQGCGEPLVSGVGGGGFCGSCYQKNWSQKKRSWSSTEAAEFIKELDVKVLKTLSVDQKELELKRILSLYRKNGFPWTSVGQSVDPRILDKVAASRVTLNGFTIEQVPKVGQSFCTGFYPQRLRASYRGRRSVEEAYEDDALLQRALSLLIDSGVRPTPARVIGVLSGFVHTPTNFQPSLARFLIETYAPNGGVVLDPCAGYGGRLLGTLASSKSITYIGRDIELENVSSAAKMAEALGCSSRVKMTTAAVEDPELWPQADVVLTGPPYYDRENYGAASSETVTKYVNFSGWVGGFLTKLVLKSLEAAPMAIFNVGEFRNDAKHVVDLPSALLGVVDRAGFKVKEFWDWRMPSLDYRSGRVEKLVVVVRT